MDKIPTIAERLVTYYNDLIENNLISGKGPVTLEWMKRQRILEGRDELDIQFGHVIVDSVLGEKTPLAKAEKYLEAVHKYNTYDLLPEIACLLSEEFKTWPFDSFFRILHENLDKEIYIPIVDFDEPLAYSYSEKGYTHIRISIDQLKFITNSSFSNEFNLKTLSFDYLSKCAYLRLVEIFNILK